MKWSIPIILFIALLAPVYAIDIAFDGFESGTFCSGSGWSATCWTKSGSTAILGWTNPYEGNRHVWLRGNTGVLNRSVDITGMNNIVISFANRVNSFESGDTAVLEVSIDGGAFTTLKTWTTNNNVWHIENYSVSGTGSSINIRFRSLMSDLGDEIHFDNIAVSGDVGIPSEVTLSMNDNYPVGSDAVITLSSTESSTLHTLQLSHNNIVFCNKTIISPSIPNTAFNVVCELPNTAMTDVEAKFFVTNNHSINTTKFFNIVSLTTSEDLKIVQTYFSPQVLQGGSTEIFTIIENNENITNLQIILTYPNNQTRSLFMQPTGNYQEYKAFITDTFLTGNVSFTIRVESTNFMDSYSNHYTVVPYNLDFVELVNKVAEVEKVKSVDMIDEPKLQVFGTEYVYGQVGKMWLQLLNSTGDDVNNGICYVDIYTPDGEEYIEHAQMTNMVHDGIYYYDLPVPNIEGVYPTIAQCYYDAIEVTYYFTDYSMITGTAVTTTIANTYTIDGQFFRTKEANGAIDRINFTMSFNNMSSCTNVPESLLSSLNIFVYGKFDSANNDNINIYIYNYTSASWILLPNKLLEGNTFRTVSNVLDTNNITKSGYYQNSNNGVLLRFEDSNIADGGPESNFDIDQLYVGCDQLANPSWQEVKGSSELHVTNPSGYRYNVETLCNDDNPLSSACMIVNETPYIDGNITLYEGTLFENITFSKPLSNKYVNQPFIYTTPNNIDCTAILEARMIHDNVTTNIIDDITYSSGTNANCILSIPMELEYADTSANVELVFDNYLRWEVLRAMDIRTVYSVFEDECNNNANIMNYTFIIPMNDTSIAQTDDNVLIYCYRVLDDLWWMDYYYNISKNITSVGDYESYHYKIAEYYLPKIEQEYLSYHTYLFHNYFNEMNNETYFGKFWNYTNRNLTYYPEQTNYSINYSRIDSTVLAINTSINTNIDYTRTNLTGRIDLLELTLSNIMYAINSSILTEIFTIPLNVWNYVTRNLTYYPPVTVNNTEIANETWNYPARYTHGIILN